MATQAEDLVGDTYAGLLRELGPELVIKLSDLADAPVSYTTVIISRMQLQDKEALAAIDLIVSASDTRQLPQFYQLTHAAKSVVDHVGRSTNMIELFLEK